MTECNFFDTAPLEVLVNIAQKLDTLKNVDSFCQAVLQNRPNSDLKHIWHSGCKNSQVFKFASWMGFDSPDSTGLLPKPKLLDIEHAVLHFLKDSAFPKSHWTHYVHGDIDYMNWLGTEDTIDSTSFKRKSQSHPTHLSNLCERKHLLLAKNDTSIFNLFLSIFFKKKKDVLAVKSSPWGNVTLVLARRCLELYSTPEGCRHDKTLWGYPNLQARLPLTVKDIDFTRGSILLSEDGASALVTVYYDRDEDDPLCKSNKKHTNVLSRRKH